MLAYQRVSLMKLDKIGWMIDAPVRLLRSLQDGKKVSLRPLGTYCWLIFMGYVTMFQEQRNPKKNISLSSPHLLTLKLLLFMGVPPYV